MSAEKIEATIKDLKMALALEEQSLKNHRYQMRNQTMGPQAIRDEEFMKGTIATLKAVIAQLEEK